LETSIHRLGVTKLANELGPSRDCLSIRVRRCFACSKLLLLVFCLRVCGIGTHGTWKGRGGRPPWGSGRLAWSAFEANPDRHIADKPAFTASESKKALRAVWPFQSFSNNQL
jgi:hypothetical protein